MSFLLGAIDPNQSGTAISPEGEIETYGRTQSDLAALWRGGRRLSAQLYTLSPHCKALSSQILEKRRRRYCRDNNDLWCIQSGVEIGETLKTRGLR